jgi:hypothetical protein
MAYVPGFSNDIFVSYSHINDREYRDLMRHLGVLKHANIDSWSDERIKPGQNWLAEIRKALENANVGVLLITTDYLTSKFITETEVPELLLANAFRGLMIFPLIAKPCAWDSVKWLSQLQLRPRGGKPIWGSKGTAEKKLAEITSELHQLLGGNSNPVDIPPPTPEPAPPPAPSLQIPHIIEKCESTQFAAIGEQLLQRGKRIVLLGTGLNLLNNHDSVFPALAERAARGECTVEIYMADPWSPDVGTRLIEEELGTPKPSVGKYGLIDRLRSNIDTLDRMGRPNNFRSSSSRTIRPWR